MVQILGSFGAIEVYTLGFMSKYKHLEEIKKNVIKYNLIYYKVILRL